MPLTLKTSLMIIAYTIGVIVFFSLFTFILYVRPIKFATKGNPADYNLEYENISFKTKDGLTLKGWFIQTKNTKAKNKAIIVGHGFPFDKNNIIHATHFLAKNFSLLYYDFRYFGESEGSYTTLGYKEAKDMQSAIDYLKKEKNITKIGIFGFSLSAATALMTDTKDVKAIVADSSYSSADQALHDIYWIFPLFTKYPFIWMTRLYAKLFLNIDIKDISPLESVKNIQKPILFIHGANDNQLPSTHSQILNDNAPNSEFWLVENAGHGASYAINPRIYKKRIIDFFDKHLK